MTGSQLIAGTVRSRLLKAAGAEAFGQIGAALVPIVTVPLLLHAWGTHVYGVWLILSTVPVYVGISDVGFATVAVNEVIMLAARGERRIAVEAFQSAWLAMLVLSAVALAVVAFVAALTPLRSLLNSQPGLGSWDAAVVLLLLSVGALIQIQMSLLSAGYTAGGKYALGSFMQTATLVLAFLAMAGGVLAGLGPVGAALASTLGTLAGASVMWWRQWRVTPWLRYGFRHVHLGRIRLLARPSLAYMAFPIGIVTSLQGVLLVVGAVLGPAAVVEFATVRTMTRLLGQVLGGVNRAVRPEFAIALGAGDMPSLRRMHRRLCAAAFWAAILTSVALSFAAGALLPTWSNGVVRLDRSLLTWLLLAVSAHVFWMASFMSLSGTNRHERVATVYAPLSFATIALVAVAANFGGLTGVAATVAAAEGVTAIVVVAHALSLTQDRVSSFVVAVLREPLDLLTQLRRAM